MSKKLRNRFIALFCLLIFAAAGFLFYNNWVVQRPFAIILFVGDGLTTSMIAPARIYHDGAQSRLDLERLPHLALLTTYANDFAVPDVAAAASALATGRKVNNRVLSLDASGKPLTSLVDLAQKGGRAVGLVSNVTLATPTLAAFMRSPRIPPTRRNSLRSSRARISISFSAAVPATSSRTRRKAAAPMVATSFSR